MNKKEISNKTVIAIIVGLIIFIIMWFTVSAISKDRVTSKESTQRLYSDCYYFSQTLVKEKLKSPKSASFPRYRESFVTDKGDTIIINAYVDADNSFGANVRTNYKATITIHNDKPDKGSVVLLE